MIAFIGAVFAACGDDLPTPPDTQSVAWISPLRKTVSANRPIRVVPMDALREFAKGKTISVGRLLQILGERKKARNPRHPWKVTVFQASSGALCRPVETADETEFVGGLPACPARWTQDKKEDGCGRTRNRAGGDGVEVYLARWRDLAPQGFCVLPADRFVDELTP